MRRFILPLPNDLAGRRTAALAVGLILFGISIALMLAAGLGVDSWDVLHQALADRLGLPFGFIVNGASLAVLALWIPLRQRPGIGTLANALVVGPVAEMTLSLVGSPSSMTGRVALLLAGVSLNGLATGMYIGAGLGPGPRDGLMTGLASTTGRSVRVVRTGIELSVLGAGAVLGGPVGPGTLLYAVAIGPIAQLSLRVFSIDGRTPESRMRLTSPATIPCPPEGARP